MATERSGYGTQKDIGCREAPSSDYRLAVNLDKLCDRPLKAGAAVRFDRPDSVRGMAGKQPEIEVEVYIALADRGMVISVCRYCRGYGLRPI